MVQSLYKYRAFIWTHALSDLRHRYAGSGMGVIWNVVHPLAMIAVYGIIFGTFFGTRMQGIHGRFGYTIFLCAGFFPWIAFSECLNRGAAAFSSNAGYLKKLPIPEQVFVAQTAVSASLTLVISFALLVILSMAQGLAPTWYWLLIPVPLLLLQAVGFGLGLICGTLNVFFPDVAQLLSIALQVLFWLAPIIYLRESAPGILPPLMTVHPMTPAVEAVRALFLHARLPEPWTIAALAAWAIGSIVCGSLLLAALRPEIRDVL